MIGVGLAFSMGVVAVFPKDANRTEAHPPVQTQQSFASSVVSGNNNNTATTWDGWPVQTTTVASFGFGRFLRPPYAEPQSPYSTLKY
jgi:hypothetical protein